MGGEQDEREVPGCVLVPPRAHTHFLLQESEQVLPGPLLPRRCALQVRANGLWAGAGSRGPGQPRPEGPEGGISDSCALSLVLLPWHISHACCLPVPLVLANDSPWAKFNIPSGFL